MTARGRTVGMLALLAATGAWISGDPVARLAASLLLGPLLLDLACKPWALGRLRIAFRPRRAVAGIPFRETVTLAHEGSRPVREVLLSEPRTMRSSGLALVDRIAPRSASEVELACRTTARGHLVERVVLAMTGWPFGLFQLRAVLATTADLVIEPARAALPPEVLQALADRDSAWTPHRRQAGDEFHALREYRDGDDARAVHARRSAALGTIVCRVGTGRQPRDFGLVLDLRRPLADSGRNSPQHAERCLGLAASLVDAMRAEQDRLQVVVLGSRTVPVTVDDDASRTRLLTLLAEAGTSAHRELEPRAFDVLRGAETVFWIPAGGAPVPTATVLGFEPLPVGGTP